jgi:hypothetical protein
VRYYKLHRDNPNSAEIPEECFDLAEVVLFKVDARYIELYYVAEQDEDNDYQKVEWFDIPSLPVGAIPITPSAFERMTGGI